MTPVWVQVLFAFASLLLGTSLIVSLRRRRWVTLLGRVCRDEQPMFFWVAMTVRALIFLMFLALAVGSISAGLMR